MRNRKRFVVGLIVSLVLLLGSGIIVYAIVNGQPDGNAHPYVGLAMFYVDVPDEGLQPAWLCSGALLSPQVFLTAGHCTDGADAAQVWFDSDVTQVPAFPFAGGVWGAPHTHPDFCAGCGPGLPRFDSHDVGVVLLDQLMVLARYAQLPSAGMVDSLPMMSDITLVGYGVQGKAKISGPPWERWQGAGIRMYAPAQLIASQHVNGNEYIKVTQNPSQGKGGSCFGDSGGPNLLGSTDTILAVSSYGANPNCAGVGYQNRIDLDYALQFIQGFLE
jgi:hypothetical protein